MPKDSIKTYLNIENQPEHEHKHAEKGKIKLHDVVTLTEDIPEHNLKRGEVGTVVEILADGEAYEVEFSDDNGQMYKCTSFLASQLTLLQEKPIKKNAAAQRLIKWMGKPPHLTDEDIEVLNQSIKDGEIPISFDSPFDLDEDEDNE